VELLSRRKTLFQQKEAAKMVPVAATSGILIELKPDAVVTDLGIPFSTDT